MSTKRTGAVHTRLICSRSGFPQHIGAVALLLVKHTFFFFALLLSPLDSLSDWLRHSCISNVTSRHHRCRMPNCTV